MQEKHRQNRHNDTQERWDQTRFVLREEEADDDAAYRHSYRDEQLLLQAVREGRTEDALRLAAQLDQDSGRLSGDGLRHRRYLAIVGIALCARAAIDGGLTPASAYRVSGYFIIRCDEALDAAQILRHRDRAIAEFAARVAEKQNHPGGSRYVEQAKVYIRKHYREKIYLADVAAALSLSPSYLSRLFQTETGQCISDFLNEERVFRAANLLAFSELTLSEISTYVGFPNQSYFGKVFKKLRGMTPKAYRDHNRDSTPNGDKNEAAK